MAVQTHDPRVEPQGAHDTSRPVAGLFQSLNHFLATFVAIVHTRLELITTELQEEVRQVGAILLWAFIAAFAAMMGLFLAALAVIFVFWDTHRLIASLAMIGLFVLVAVVAGLILKHKLSTKPPLLDDTLAELAKDRDQLKARL
ncbi:MAG TPA: phage holin family protein [Steroidobacter sp.]|uniref:phage holin family protein n=1 Tax=Steroidobacter sp. TaxID=1978227 RepID=UPI002ED7A681